jgi:tetratricopeptide (TPR) repeat protein
VEAQATVTPESITITTSRVGHPLLVKVSYHPRWIALGADGPYLASPGLMIVVPREPVVRLLYAPAAADRLGLWLTTLAGIGALASIVLRRVRRPAAPAPVVLPEDSCEIAPAPRRWGAAVPAGVILVLCASRALAGREPAPDPLPLYESASRAYAADRFADAAEYARHALTRATGSSLRPELLCLRGESLLRSGQPRLAAQAFEAVVQDGPGPYLPQALFGNARAYAAMGKPGEADLARERLLRDHAGTPWARRALAEPGTGPVTP